MKTQYKLPYMALSAGMFCTLLTACGGGGDDTTSLDDNSGDTGLNGITIDSSNYLSVIETGVIDSARLARQLMTSGDDIELSTLSLTSVSGADLTYQCHNGTGTFQIIEISADTQEWIFNDCHITTESPDTSYDGVATIKRTIHSGSAENVGSYLHNWSVTQVISLTDYNETSPIIGGESSTANGSMVLDSSNNLTTDLNIETMTSSDLQFDVVNASSVSTRYYFSDYYYDEQEDISDETSQTDIAFTGNITGLGDLQLDINPALVFDADVDLQSGTAHITTGNSSAKIVGTGNDDVEISLDPENDGLFEAPMTHTWFEIAGD